MTYICLIVNIIGFICSVCGYEEDRDIHTAKNMIRFYYIKTTRWEPTGISLNRRCLRFYLNTFGIGSPGGI